MPNYVRRRVEDYPLVREGSAKNIRRADKESLIFEATENFSVFDYGRSPDIIENKGLYITACAVQSFMIAEGLGVPTHFIERIAENAVRVKEVQTIMDRPMIQTDENYLLPGEWIYRLRNAGSIERDFRSSKKKPEDYGLPKGEIPAFGVPFPFPIEHMTTKFEKYDRDITSEEACNMCGITMKDKAEYWAMIHRVIGGIHYHMASVGFTTTDGKLECIMGKGRQKSLGDFFCTPDEDRPVRIDDLKNGIASHYGKEFLRQYYISIGYYDTLMEARKKGLSDPPMPRLPEVVKAEASERYRIFAHAYCG